MAIAAVQGVHRPDEALPGSTTETGNLPVPPPAAVATIVHETHRSEESLPDILSTVAEIPVPDAAHPADPSTAVDFSTKAETSHHELLSAFPSAHVGSPDDRAVHLTSATQSEGHDTAAPKDTTTSPPASSDPAPPVPSSYRKPSAAVV